MITVNLQSINKITALKRQGEDSPFVTIKVQTKDSLGGVTFFLDNIGEAWLLLDAAQDAVDLLQEREA